MPINASHEYFDAEKKYFAAQTLEEKIRCLEELIRKAPHHKGSENLLAELKTRLKKFRGKLEKSKKTGKGKKGIRKEGFQVALIGKTNSGKSSLLRKLTNASPKVSESRFTTVEPELGTMYFKGVRAQIVDLPSIGGKDFDYNVANNADCLLIVVSALEWSDEINENEKFLEKSVGKRIVVFNKIDRFSEGENGKLEQRIRAKRIKDYVLVSAKSGAGLENLKGKILGTMGVVRVFTKEPGKEKNKDPVVLPEGSTVKDVAETIYKGFSGNIKETRLTGPSGKFSNQRVGLKHKLKDMDVVEFRD
jgi:uncharacterized protein